MQRRADGRQRELRPHIVRQHVDHDAVALDDGRAVRLRHRCHDDGQHGDGDLRRGGDAVRVGLGVAEAVRPGVAWRRGIEHLAVLDDRGAELRCRDPREGQRGAAVVGEHVHQHGGALVERRPIADRDRPGLRHATDAADRDARRVRAKGGQVERQHQRGRTRHVADIHRHDMRDTQIERAVGRKAADGDAGCQVHGAVGLDVEQVVGLRQADRAEHRRPGPDIAQRDLERIAGMPRILEQLPAEHGERQRGFRRAEREALAQRGQLVALLGKRRLPVRDRHRPRLAEAEPGGGGVADREIAVDQRTRQRRGNGGGGKDRAGRGLSLHDGFDASRRLFLRHDGRHGGYRNRDHVLARREDAHPFVKVHVHQRTRHRAVREIRDAKGVAVFVLQHRQQVEMLGRVGPGDGDQGAVRPGGVLAVVESGVPAHASRIGVDGDRAVEVAADRVVRKLADHDLYRVQRSLRIREQARVDPVLLGLGRILGHLRQGQVRIGGAERRCGADHALLWHARCGAAAERDVVQEVDLAERVAGTRGHGADAAIGHRPEQLVAVEAVLGKRDRHHVAEQARVDLHAERHGLKERGFHIERL